MNKSQKLVDSIINGIQDKKGSGIVVADLTQTDGAVCSYFIICQGNSPTQVEAIAGSVGDYVREAEGEKKEANETDSAGNNQTLLLFYLRIR